MVHYQQTQGQGQGGSGSVSSLSSIPYVVPRIQYSGFVTSSFTPRCLHFIDKHVVVGLVHNLVLNPEQNSLCELKPIRQILTHAHCTSREMSNHVCVGTCFSYTVPQTEPETPGDELLDYCDSCQASESHWSTIELECEEDGSTYQVTKRVQMITNCSCSPCHPSRSPPTQTHNEVTYPANDHHISELLLYKMLPESHRFKEAAGLTDRTTNTFNRELQQHTKVSLDELKKKIYLTPDQEQELHGNIVFDFSQDFQDINEEEEPRVVNL
ncbi:hypothetical protein Pmani_002839 [Petrolisthes manimaculis]|uniref:CTCK domain-containing protein n=1 Tax=Petrolisthes manimaculis TaxID=1843537 RepID=A0AAE1QHS6_9EUCA|nr:hypothetical protein Pmani_002839 [Petrolisthes manimaculis]